MTMSPGLQISVGQHSDKGRKPINQDFHGVLIPQEPLLSLKGVAAVFFATSSLRPPSSFSVAKHARTATQW